MQLSVRIQATEKRERWVKTMQYMLGDQAVPSFDTTNSLWGGCRQTLLSADKKATHILVLQDDVLPCKDLIATAEEIAELLPDKPISFFTNRWRGPSLAKQAGSNWFTCKIFLMAQCYMLPVGMAEDFVRWADKHIHDSIYFDDNRLAMYLVYHQQKAWFTTRSLVEHLGWNSTTLRGYTNKEFDTGRMAHEFIGVENSGLSIDWTKGMNGEIEEQESTAGRFERYYLP